MTATTVQVRVPTILRTYTNGEADVSVDVGSDIAGDTATVADVVSALDAAYPGIGGRVLDDQGQIRRFVNVYLDDDDVRFADGLATPVRSGARVSVIPAVAGG